MSIEDDDVTLVDGDAANDAGASADTETAPGSPDATVEGFRVVRGRELARLLRRQAYRRAKELRAKDPKYLAMKELAKTRRREAGRQAREKRKAEQSIDRATEKKEATARKAGERARRDEELKALLTRAPAGAKAPVDAASAARGAGGEGSDEPEERSQVFLRIREPRDKYDVN